MGRSIKAILMERDGMTAEEASQLIKDAREDFNERMAEGDLGAAEDVLEEYFGLEPDYIFELIG